MASHLVCHIYHIVVTAVTEAESFHLTSHRLEANLLLASAQATVESALAASWAYP